RSCAPQRRLSSARRAPFSWQSTTFVFASETSTWTSPRTEVATSTNTALPHDAGLTERPEHPRHPRQPLLERPHHPAPRLIAGRRLHFERHARDPLRLVGEVIDLDLHRRLG